MRSFMGAIKKAVAPKVAVKKTVVTKEVKVTCSNCEDSGRECNECGAGKDVV